MNTKTTFFWLTTLAVVLASVIVSLHSSNSFGSTISTPLDSIHRIFELEFFGKVARKLGVEDIVGSVLERIVYRRHHHHHHHHPHRRGNESSCNNSLWKSDLISLYNISVVYTVDTKGCANFSSVQKAIDALPDFSHSWTLIILDSGTYREKVVVSSNKTNLIVQGQGYLNTVIAWNDTANSTGGTSYSSTFATFAPSFVAYNISFMNTAPAPDPGEVGGQAVALRASGDQSAFYGCGFYGAQDTLNDDHGRHYYKECYIQGSIDFIFGNGRSLFEDCTINSTAKEVSSGGISGCITAHGRDSANEKTGFAFVNCSIREWKSVVGASLGHYATTIFSKTYMSEVVAAEGWNDWRDSSRDQTVSFGEYECYGPGANSTYRVAYGKQLKQSEAAHYLDASFIDGEEWLVPASKNSLDFLDTPGQSNGSCSI
ncbi:UNVERIFIED_CONTAM: putative pectinesterase 15 [Sesamum radiatum]|uniref:Pectinesterase n=1 Tax=Sesamum radiatum TaxID=300843 RepID=A0AAW2NN81_SESRA